VTVIPIYNTNGVKVDSISINDELDYVSGRVCKGKTLYYKGVGVPYQHHFVINPDDRYKDLGRSGVFYLGNAVVKPEFVDKYGIFQERYQPFFPDFIGSCSIKEGTIVINSISFEMSTVEVVDCVKFDEVNQQHYYVLDYKCGRVNYLDGGNPKDLRNLLDYMLRNQWNFLWDKTSIGDISASGGVSDVADLFVSGKLEHQLGTAYSVLYSLSKLDQVKYQEFLRYIGMRHTTDMDYVFIAARLLHSVGIDIKPLFPYAEPIKNYKYILLNYLLTGKNCAYCSCDLFMNEGNQVRDEYVKNMTTLLKHI
jgi:hypothetical protein